MIPPTIEQLSHEPSSTKWILYGLIAIIAVTLVIRCVDYVAISEWIRHQSTNMYQRIKQKIFEWTHLEKTANGGVAFKDRIDYLD
jgi:hypothetical protein